MLFQWPKVYTQMNEITRLTDEHMNGGHGVKWDQNPNLRNKTILEKNYNINK